MRITPLDIRQHQFSVRTFRGFDTAEVDAFLDDVADDYEAVLKENALLREQLATHEDQSRSLAERERALQETLLTAQRVGEEIKTSARREAESLVRDARREAELLVREAELRSEKVLEEVRGEEARVRSQVETLKRMRRQLAEDLRAKLESYYRMMSAEMDDAAPEEDEDGA